MRRGRARPVERTGDVAVMLQKEIGRSRQLLFSGAGLCGLQLFVRQRHAGGFREVERKANPAAADVEYAIAGLDQQLGRNMTLFGELSVVQRGGRLFKIAAGYCRSASRNSAHSRPSRS